MNKVYSSVFRTTLAILLACAGSLALCQDVDQQRVDEQKPAGKPSTGLVDYLTEESMSIGPTVNGRCEILYGEGTTIPKGITIKIIGAIRCGDDAQNRVVSVLWGGKIYYLHFRDIKLRDEDFEKIYEYSKTEQGKSEISRLIFEERAANSKAELARKSERDMNLKPIAKKLAESSRVGLLVISAGPVDSSEYTKGTDFHITLKNTSKVKIKYIYFNLTGLNAVGDPVYDRARSRTDISLRAIGPISPGDTETFKFDYVWFSDLVQYSRLNSIRVEFFDGKTVLVNNTERITLHRQERELYESNR